MVANAGSNTAVDHITVLGRALAQMPDALRFGSPILIRSDSAGSSQAFLGHIRGLREHGLDTEFSVGVAITAPIRAAITTITGNDWVAALDGDGSLRDGAQVVEVTDYLGPRRAGRVPGRHAADLPAGTPASRRATVVVRPGQRMRHQVFATDTPHGGGSIQFLEVRHRCHARVEDRIRTGRNTGFGRFPSRQFAINARGWNSP